MSPETKAKAKAAIGHEISHGFDDQGAQYDADGTLRNWWTDEDQQKFKAATSRLVAQYAAYCPLPAQADKPAQCVNGELTPGENIADLAGLTVAYSAYQLALAGKSAPVLDGFTGDPRFFLGAPGRILAVCCKRPFLFVRREGACHAPCMSRIWLCAIGLALGCGGLADSDGKRSAAAPGAGATTASNGARPGTGAQPTSPLVSIPPGGPPSESAAAGIATTGPRSTFPAGSAAQLTQCTPPDPNIDDLIKAKGENVVMAYCGSCHGPQLGDEGAGGLSYINDFALLISQGWLVPCDPERSPIVEVMRSAAMPPSSSGLPFVCPFDVDVLVDELARFYCTPVDGDAGSSGVADAGSAGSSDAGP
jgi:hypothetical protein